MSFTKLWSELQKLITRLKKGKQSEDACNMVIEQDEQLRQEGQKIKEDWPQLGLNMWKFFFLLVTWRVVGHAGCSRPYHVI